MDKIEIFLPKKGDHEENDNKDIMNSEIIWKESIG
jgi:hypothetical protein